jgi:transposase
MFERERTKPYIIRYALYLYFLGLSFKDTSKAIHQPFIDRSYVAIWDWIQQRFDPRICKEELHRSKAWAYKWLSRFQRQGLEGLRKR